MRRTYLLLLAGMIIAAGTAVAADVEADFSDPVLLRGSRVAPEYPPAALAARFEGTITLSARVQSDGSVANVDILDSSKPNLGFEEAATRAVKQWKFVPASQDGEAIDAYVVYSLAFNAPPPGSRTSAFVRTGYRGSAITMPHMGSISIAGGRLNPPGAISTARDTGKGLHTVEKPPCAEVGCMYDRRQLVPPQRRTRNPSSPTSPLR